MTKTLLISIGAVIIIGLLALAYFLSGRSAPAQPQNNQNVGLPISGNNATGGMTVTTGQSATSTPAAGQATMPVAVNGSGTMQVLNFISDPATVKDPLNPGYYYLGYHQYEGVPDPTVTTAPPYVISYTSATQYFNIVLLQEPIGPTRTAAEQYLIAHLGISQDQMCALKYTVSTPYYVNLEYSGENLGFSFCPSATKLPK